MSGWIKIHRGMLDNPAVCKDSDHLAIWIHLLLNATHKPHDILIGNKRVTLQPGDLATSRKALSVKYKVEESKVERILKLFKNEQQIEQQSYSTNRIISVLNWHKYQEIEQQNEQRVNSERTASEQRVNTNKNERKKELKNERNKDLKDISDKSPEPTRSTFKPPALEEVIAYCEERGNSVDAAKWHDFYASKGWMVGKNKMKDWKAAVRTWEQDKSTTRQQRKETSFDVLQRMMREGDGHGAAGRVEVNHNLFG